MSHARIVIDRAAARTLKRPGGWQVTLMLPAQRSAEYVERWQTVEEARADAARLHQLTGAVIDDRTGRQRQAVARGPTRSAADEVARRSGTTQRG